MIAKKIFCASKIIAQTMGDKGNLRLQIKGKWFIAISMESYYCQTIKNIKNYANVRYYGHAISVVGRIGLCALGLCFRGLYFCTVDVAVGVYEFAP